MTYGSRHGAGQDPVKRAQILAGAQKIFFNKSFEAASMNDIARQAGVSKGTLYVYFADKDALFEAICYEYRRDMFSELAGILENGPYNKERIIIFGTVIAQRFLAESAVSAQRIVLGIRDRNPDVTCSFYQSGPKHMLEKLAHYLEHLVELKQLQIADTHLAACQLVDLFFAGLYRPRLFGVITEEEALQRIEYNVKNAVDLFFKGYAVE
ncbi:TetR/AcrR family transcriptional regulator [Paenochrobactrum sp. BZR 588]|uniref:TetR/AcrR family transcriptional regulator n=1 Tax=Paenochrobactrum TaxID=999488 RepID=UPI0035BC39BB